MRRVRIDTSAVGARMSDPCSWIIYILGVGTRQGGREYLCVVQLGRQEGRKARIETQRLGLQSGEEIGQ